MDAAPELTAVLLAVANAEIVEFRNRSWRLRPLGHARSTDSVAYHPWSWPLDMWITIDRDGD